MLVSGYGYIQNLAQIRGVSREFPWNCFSPDFDGSTLPHLHLNYKIPVVFFFAKHRFGPWILFSTRNGGDFHMIQLDQHLFQNGWLSRTACEWRCTAKQCSRRRVPSPIEGMTVHTIDFKEAEQDRMPYVKDAYW